MDTVVHLTERASHAYVSATGDLTGADAVFVAALDRVASTHQQTVIVDLTDVTSMDDAALQSLVDLEMRLGWTAASIMLVGTSLPVFEAIRSVRVDGFFTFCPTLEQALRCMWSRPALAAGRMASFA